MAIAFQIVKSSWQSENNDFYCQRKSLGEKNENV